MKDKSTIYDRNEHVKEFNGKPFLYDNYFFELFVKWFFIFDCENTTLRRYYAGNERIFLEYYHKSRYWLMWFWGTSGQCRVTIKQTYKEAILALIKYIAILLFIKAYKLFKHSICDNDHE